MSIYREQLEAIGFVSGLKPEDIKGYVLIVDNGSRRAEVFTDLPLVDCAAMVIGVGEIVAKGAVTQS